LMGAIFGWLVGQNYPTTEAKKIAVCEYLNGSWHDDVCIQNNVVVEIKGFDK